MSSSHSHRHHHSGCLHKQGEGDEVGPSVCPFVEDPDPVYQATGDSQSSWFWDLVAMFPQIPLCLSNLVKPFNQTLHRSLSNLNLHAWLQEPQHSRSRASLMQWQHELRLLKEDQPDQSMRQSEPFLQSGASVIRWTSGHHL